MNFLGFGSLYEFAIIGLIAILLFGFRIPPVIETMGLLIQPYVRRDPFLGNHHAQSRYGWERRYSDQKFNRFLGLLLLILVGILFLPNK